ncbi:hypothetical protein Tco_0481597 [Tanacetum coccineum]
MVSCEDVEYEEVNDVEQEEKEFDLEDIFQIQDVILREKLLNVHRLISNIESLKVNPTLDRVLKSPFSIFQSPSRIMIRSRGVPILSFLIWIILTRMFETIEPDQEGLISIDNEPLLELPEFESFHFDPSFPRPPPEPPDVEICLYFEPDAPVIDNFNELNDDQRGSEIDFSEDDDSFTFVIRTFLPFLTYPEVSLLSCSTGRKIRSFDPGSLPLRLVDSHTEWNFHVRIYEKSHENRQKRANMDTITEEETKAGSQSQKKSNLQSTPVNLGQQKSTTKDKIQNIPL